LRAEYRAKTGDYGGAVADLNVVRRRAGCSDYSGGTEELRREISRERDRELFCEGDRFLDLVREGFVEDLPGFRDMTQQDIENGRLFIPLSRTAFQNNTQMTQCPYWEQRGF
ncbi:RagB/SusD family nutrient uptake outer membrane protein, partial [Parabacteroides goldsteinii]|uniref:RagB/SusD family nutrient uptake outer membrane protein n=2 Tax=Bacteroidia TaxID=200643 RepID=UPI00259B9C15